MSPIICFNMFIQFVILYILFNNPLFNNMFSQFSAYSWTRFHRSHHKFSETDADPHNAKRGFFFSHIGWLVLPSHPEVKRKMRTIEMSDLKADPILMFQHKNYVLLMITFCFILPTIAPILFWNESFRNSFCINILRFIATFNSVSLVNSVAHLWGSKPYDR